MQSVLTAALEAGVSTMLFSRTNAHCAKEWSQLARFKAVLAADDGLLRCMEQSDDNAATEKVSLMPPSLQCMQTIWMVKTRLSAWHA